MKKEIVESLKDLTIGCISIIETCLVGIFVICAGLSSIALIIWFLGLLIKITVGGI